VAEPSPGWRGAVRVRDAAADDVPGMLAIYNQVVLSSDALWRDEPVDLADRLAWFEAQQAAGMPVLVAVPASGGAAGAADDAVLGFASFVQFRSIPGYFPTVEHSIHVRDGLRGRGIGSLLLDALTERARAMGRSVMVAGLDAGNVGSQRFHERAGFREVARMPGVGRKWGRPVDLVLLQRDLTEAVEVPPGEAPPSRPDGDR
jgi:L-amino acid N-acyltransferase YncA